MATSTEAVVTVLEPATEEVLAELPEADAAAADEAVARAKAAFPSWRAVAPGERARLLLRVADALEARPEELARLGARNVGQAIAGARGENGGGVVALLPFPRGPGRLLRAAAP